MKKYIVFDLDGTLIKSSKVLTEIICKYLEKNYGVDYEKSKYILSTTRGMALFLQIKEILNIELEEAKKITKKIYEEINLSEKGNFFDGVPEKIIELSKRYKLFLSTGNSTKFAEENLEKGNIINCFDYILGSEDIPKSYLHIDIFKENSGDENFEKFCIFVGDGEKDREIAKNCGINFIHIDENLENVFGDEFEIKSVSDISPILEKLNKNYD